ncbi:MAG: hypothetical protein JST96_07955 [Bacteroidetes bacterium]|nr:hypothetical protein [Bacteroidota bacterium]
MEKIVSLMAITVLLTFSFVYAQDDEVSVDNTLHTLKDIRVISKTVNYEPYSLEYSLAIRQPIDHSDTTKGFFYQQFRLLHRGFSKPMVMETEGYDGREPHSELQKILDANDIDVEFRYFNQSKPNPLDWRYANFEQAVADLHHINQVFHALYHSKWISTGISRGGETTITYRYFYPDDVDASVPYVAPMPNDIEDKRIYAFLDTAGGAACAKKIRNVQTFLLQHEQEALAKIPVPEKSLHYTFVGGVGQAYEYMVMEYPFSFWQISMLTEKDIPTNNNLDSCLAHIYKIFGSYISTFADEENERFIPHSYMTYQTGYYKYNIAPFKNYLHYLTGANPTAAPLPPSIARMPYDPDFEKKINAWIAKSGNNILYIYGGRDTWSACKAEFGNGVNAQRFIIPGMNHYYARIRTMPPSMQQQFGDALYAMTGLRADFSKLQ